MEKQLVKNFKLSLYLIVPLLCIWGLKVLLSGPSSEMSGGQTSLEVSEAVPEIISYNFDVRPILSDKCYTCHGPDAEARQANLRLDTEEGAFGVAKNLSNLPIIKSGDPKGSALVFCGT